MNKIYKSKTDTYRLREVKTITGKGKHIIEIRKWFRWRCIFITFELDGAEARLEWHIEFDNCKCKNLDYKVKFNYVRQ